MRDPPGGKWVECRMNEVSFSELNGKTILEITGLAVGSERVEFRCDDGTRYLMYHYEDCCESVRIIDITGDAADLIGVPLGMAEESTNKDNPPEYADSFTWTFYKLRTIKGDVTIRWLGESNGYYSESVAFTRLRVSEVVRDKA